MIAPSSHRDAQLAVVTLGAGRLAGFCFLGSVSTGGGAPFDSWRIYQYCRSLLIFCFRSERTPVFTCIREMFVLTVTTQGIQGDASAGELLSLY